MSRLIVPGKRNGFPFNIPQCFAGDENSDYLDGNGKPNPIVNGLEFTVPVSLSKLAKWYWRVRKWKIHIESTMPANTLVWEYIYARRKYNEVIHDYETLSEVEHLKQLALGNVAWYQTESGDQTWTGESGPVRGCSLEFELFGGSEVYWQFFRNDGYSVGVPEAYTPKDCVRRDKNNPALYYPAIYLWLALGYDYNWSTETETEIDGFFAQGLGITGPWLAVEPVLTSNKTFSIDGCEGKIRCESGLWNDPTVTSSPADFSLSLTITPHQYFRYEKDGVALYDEETGNRIG